MKLLTTLLVSVALLSTAFAQKTPPQFKQAISKLHIVAPAAKPLLLHTGKPLTQIDKQKFLAAIIKTAPAGTRKPKVSSAPPSTITLTPQQAYQGNTSFGMMNPSYVDILHGEFSFAPGAASNIIFIIKSQPNDAYLLAIKVNSFDSTPQFTIGTTDLDSGLIVNSENFTGSQGDIEFAYGVVANSEGVILVTIYSPHSYWSFESCQITSTAF